LTVQDALNSFVAWPVRWKMLAFATTVVLIELALRYLAPRSRAYAGWTRFFRGIGTVWTAIILAVVYVVSVGPIGLILRLLGRDPLDRHLVPEPTFWRPHEPNPLGPEKAARHQF
jgi:hypothetical protein